MCWCVVCGVWCVVCGVWCGLRAVSLVADIDVGYIYSHYVDCKLKLQLMSLDTLVCVCFF